MRTVWAYRRVLGLGTAVIALFAFYITVIAPAAFSGGPGRSSGAVGGLFVRTLGLTVPHPFCTASIVDSSRGDLLVTAAHCLGKVPVSQMVFIPYFHNGTSPFGQWPVTSQTFPKHWFPGGSIGRDFAFLTVSGDVQARAGAEKLGVSYPLARSARLEGYSLSGGPVICTGRPASVVRAGHRQLRFECPGFSDAASGGPFLTHVSRKSGLGTIVGVIGGYQQGGSSSSVSYASPLGSMAMTLARQLARRRA
jgi:hypothetical protein